MATLCVAKLRTQILDVDHEKQSVVELCSPEFSSTVNDKLITERLMEKCNKLSAENERLKAEMKAENEHLKAEMKAENERLEAEMKAENERLEAEMKAENERLEAEMKAENERLKAENERLEAEMKAENERLKAEMKAKENGYFEFCQVVKEKQKLNETSKQLTPKTVLLLKESDLDGVDGCDCGTNNALNQNDSLNVRNIEKLQEEIRTLRATVEKLKRDSETMRSERDHAKKLFRELEEEVFALRADNRSLRQKFKLEHDRAAASARALAQYTPTSSTQAALNFNFDLLETSSTHQHRKSSPGGKTAAAERLPSNEKYQMSEWPCLECTFLNAFDRTACQMCGMARGEYLVSSRLEVD